MRNQVLSSLLIASLLLPSFTWAKDNKTPVRAPASASVEFNIEKECPNGSCIEDLVNLAEAKSKDVIESRCLPDQEVVNQEAWFENNPMNFDCYIKIQDLQKITEKVDLIKNHFGASGNDKDQAQNCCQASVDPVFDSQNIADVEKANAQAMCTEEKRAAIQGKCVDDVQCLIKTSSLSFATGPLAEIILNKVDPKLKALGCDPSKDDCVRQFALSFVKSAIGFFEGAWDLLKMIGSGIKNKVVGLWDKLTNAEKHSSTAQLTMAKASEDEGVFQMLKNDFTGTMVKLYQGLVEAIKEWLASSMFCQEWEGTPQFSECKRPATGFDCLECKTMITGLCSVGGALLTEIIPAFLTGGIVSCVKHGASAATKLARLIKVSEVTAKLIKESKLVTSVVKRGTEISEALELAKIGGAALKFATKYGRYLKIFYASPVIRRARAGLTKMGEIASRSTNYIMLSKAGPLISFTGKVAKYTGKVIIFPIDNPLVNRAFLSGEKFFDKVILAASKAKVFNPIRPLLAGEAARLLKGIDDAYIELKVTEMLKPNPEKIAELELKYINTIRKNRAATVGAYLEAKPNVNFEQLLEELYPDLIYGKYGQHVSDSDILKAEDDIFEAISRMNDKKNKDRLSQELTKYFNSVAREKHTKLMSIAREDVLSNAKLLEKDRIERALTMINVHTEKIPYPLKKKLTQGIIDAQKAVENNVFNHDNKVLARKILKKAGFTNEQAAVLVNGGLVGLVSPLEKFEALSRVVVSELTPELVHSFKNSKVLSTFFKGLNPEQERAMAQAIQIFENDGLKLEEVAAIMKNYKDDFLAVMMKQPSGENGTAYLAEYIRREIKAGRSEAVIKKKIFEAFKNCY